MTCSIADYQRRATTSIAEHTTDEDAAQAAPIVARVAFENDLAPEAILGRSRTAPLVNARAIVMLELRQAGWSLPRIGRALDRDHTTILHHLDQAARRLEWFRQMDTAGA